MALIDIDRHILMELVLLQEKIRIAAEEFVSSWDDIQDVISKTELIIKDIEHPELPKLRDKIIAAKKICNTKMAVIADAISKKSALYNHMVSMVEEVDTGRGIERGR